MTDPTGRSFLSYRRIRRHEVELLIAAQHDHGIPTWQDIRNLDETPTEAALRNVLLDPTTANAVLWITPEVTDSSVIRTVEAPLILQRAQAGDDFFLIPAAAGGLDYRQAAQVLDQTLTIENLEDWNLRKIEADPIGPAEAAAVARRVLQRRLAALHYRLPQGEPFRLRLFTRVAPAFEPGYALTLDWTGRFQEREAEPSSWDNYLLPALHAVVDALRTQAPGRTVEASGFLAIPAAAALGCAFLAPGTQAIAWRQVSTGRPDQFWSLRASREDSGFAVSTVPSKTTGMDLAVMVSVASNVEHAVAAGRDHLPPFRAFTKVAKDGTYPHLIQSPGEAVDIAYKVVEAMRKARDEFRPLGVIHLFMAVPVGLAMLIGQLLNTFGPVQTYEHIPVDAIGRYRPAALLKPSE